MFYYYYYCYFFVFHYLLKEMCSLDSVGGFKRKDPEKKFERGGKEKNRKGRRKTERWEGKSWKT